MKHNFKTYCLLVVSMLMLIASVFPHHHHAERLCLNPDLETCCPSHPTDDGKHYPGDSDNHTCNSGCVTHFSFSSQHTRHIDVAPDYAFFSLTYPLLNLLERFSLHNEPTEHVSIYIEKLHARHYAATGSLRAPPFFS